ncbi:hypothetical protein Ae201684P_010620 [Aphanomyces euteiches]|uniref:Uncharacterized protein n=1 Tax=Aphanomyces euteiches TaxID=100861 RepID=A0A6G0WPB1_9STRA|nr:hypothetical protein Ae201684_013176 [Aphanomyces euteiches]KAH9076684.1 hypothetical protein Ae201684P_010620 [Aphanomyces euteiches]
MKLLLDLSSRSTVESTVSWLCKPVLDNKTHESDRLRFGRVMTLQWHLIARLDDMMKLSFGDLSYNPSHPSTLLCQMRWSKNITEEREAPRQIILASIDDRICPLLNLAVFIEYTNPTAEKMPFSMAMGQTTTGSCVNCCPVLLITAIFVN